MGQWSPQYHLQVEVELPVLDVDNTHPQTAAVQEVNGIHCTNSRVNDSVECRLYLCGNKMQVGSLNRRNCVNADFLHWVTWRGRQLWWIPVLMLVLRGSQCGSSKQATLNNDLLRSF